MDILLIEDNLRDVELLNEILCFSRSPPTSIVHVSSAQEGIKKLLSASFDIVLLDLSLPDGQGVSNVTKIRRQKQDIPIVVLTGLDDEDTAIKSLRQGADDYIVKGEINSNYIVRSIRHAIERKRSEKELREALEKAEVANKTKTAFLANMSHELRTPLNAVMGFSELIKREIYGPIGDCRYLEYAEDIHASGKYLLELISDLLDLAKAESDKFELDEHVISINQVLYESWHLLKTLAYKSQIRIVLDLWTPPPYLLADFRLLKQVFINLISNSLKFTPQGGIIMVRTIVNAQKNLEIEVRDNGVGMAEEDIPKALTTFGQAGRPLGNRPGTGLGLPLAKRFIELHEGLFYITSKINEGTVVKVTLPSWRVQQNVA